jgi:hypothetical protein
MSQNIPFQVNLEVHDVTFFYLLHYIMGKNRVKIKNKNWKWGSDITKLFWVSLTKNTGVKKSGMTQKNWPGLIKLHDMYHLLIY